MFFHKQNEKGFAAFFITVMVSSIILGISASIFILNYGEQAIIANVIKSKQAYYAAEAGAEDALLRLRKNMEWSNPITFNIGDAQATTTISQGLGGTKIITSEGDQSNRIKRTQLVYEISSDNASFFYGAQIGEGGVVLDNLSKIEGNVFSNGSIIGESDNIINGVVKVAKNGNKIQKIKISGDAYVDICEDSDISGILNASTSIGCTASQTQPLTEEIATTSLPISQQQIADWKNEAAAGGVHSGDYNFSGSVDYLGPKKIEGNFTVGGSAELLLTGVVWVTGNVNIKNNAILRLDESSYGSFSGMIVSDGLITLENNSISSGSGDPGSYLMYLSTAASNPAIIIKNNAIVDILYTSNGWIEVDNNAILREITGYGIHLKNNAEITYEIGLEDVSFLSGPGGGWKVTSWKEIE